MISNITHGILRLTKTPAYKSGGGHYFLQLRVNHRFYRFVRLGAVDGGLFSFTVN